MIAIAPDEGTQVAAGDVLVADMTDPDWEPVMKLASAIVTNRGGRTCHAAIIARELGIPAVVGCGDATSVLSDNQMVTVSCTEGDTGNVYRGVLEVEVLDLALETMPKPPVKIALNVGNPELAFAFQRLPNDGVGLARLEFIIARMIGIHPMGSDGSTREFHAAATACREVADDIATKRTAACSVTLDQETEAEAEEPEKILDAVEERMPASARAAS